MQKLKKPDFSSRIESTLASLRSSGRNLLLQVGPSSPSLLTIALTVLFLLALLMLSGCQPRVVRPSLPVQADPRPLPEFKGKTYRDALIHIPELREAFLSCEADKAAIRKAMGDE